MTGKTILHYKILEKLGEGGMGVVYKAEDTKLERDVAIKFLPHHIAANAEERERFKIEAKAAAALNHPNIATIHAIEEYDDEMFIVMEYIDGRELRDIVGAYRDTPLPADTCLPVDQIINIATQIAEGLKAAHAKGVTHRDIKSGNIMVTESGQVKIMDFGLAKMGGDAHLTKAGATLGTVAYMSPEQLQGAAVDQRADLWSFGVVLYEMLTGQTPFRGEYDAATIYEILNEGPQAVQNFRDDVPASILSLLSGLLKKDPAWRIKSAQEVLQKLAEVPGPATSEAGDNSIAVLYFENMSQEKENDYFCAGMTEDLIIDLSKIGSLRVIPRSDVLPFRDQQVKVRQAGELLRAAYIVEGSVRKAGSRIRITAQLIDARSGFQMWAERYDRLLEDIFEVQTEVSQKIAAALKLSLSESEKQLLAQKPTTDLRAYDFYLRGREFLLTSGKENNESAIRMFQHALEIDPNYSLACVALAEAYSYQYWWFDGDQKWLGKVIEMNEKALSLDANLVEAKFGIGMVFFHQKRFSDAKKMFEKVIEQNKDFYPAHRWLGVTFDVLKDHAGALQSYIRASEIKPYSEEPWLQIEMCYRRLGDKNASRRAAQKVLELVQQKLEADANDGVALSRMAATYVILGQKMKAIAALKKVMQVAPGDALALYNASCTYAQLGKKQEALEFLQKALSFGYRNILEWVATDPDYESIREDPGFKKLLSS
jgi:non-specific serine/threonine protein kinase